MNLTRKQRLKQLLWSNLEQNMETMWQVYIGTSLEIENVLLAWTTLIGVGVFKLRRLMMESEVFNNIIGIVLLIGAGWFAWESSMMVDEMKRKRRKK